ncbi:DUF2793 domain-containing protein [Hephaestia sp. GCM10023244]|uniref:DUF2793 domain-containing protein n=1 Tax=unclassified Hephaestia TaxID=2631281 RepID=UPI0020774D3E|nr:DUF2793 domain-containing protein [Hephaestia sp. MAHUQ-44]MCM8729711.1 DUF2793 domain-containing protein [Hephaestia sp. MAHUQ-44]
MTDDTSARLALPLLNPGQAQKEMTHNEALALLDLAIGASVREIGVDAPPPVPAIGACWIVGPAPTGAWAGHTNAIAGWTGGGWRFVMPIEGMPVWVEAAGLPARFVAGTWQSGDIAAAHLVIGGHRVVGAQGAPIADPTGGATIDLECRNVLGTVIAALRTHGLIAS